MGKFMKMFIALFVVILPGLWGVEASAAEVYHAKSDDSVVRAHDGYRHHLHTRSHEHPAVWRTLAEVNIEAEPGDVWSAVAEVNILWHEAQRLSFSMRIIACEPSSASIDLSGGLPTGTSIDLSGGLPMGTSVDLSGDLLRASPDGVPPGCYEILGSAVTWIDRSDRYVQLVRETHWGVPAAGDLRVMLQARLLSIPRGGRQGHKVFMVPGNQWMSIAVH